MWWTINKWIKIYRSNIPKQVGGNDEREYRKDSKGKED